MKQSPKQVRRSEKQIRQLLKHQQEQNISVSTFCKLHNIHKATFYNWRNKYGLVTDGPQFVPIQFSEPLATMPFAEIAFGSNIFVKIYQQVDAGWFKTLQ